MTRPQRRFQVDGIDARVYPDRQQLGAAAAAFVAARVQKLVDTQGEARIIFATGVSQYAFLDALIQAPGVDWLRVTAFHLDEYLGLPADHPAGLRRVLRERLFNRLPFGAIHLLNGDTSDPGAECARYANVLAERPIDLACIGIGENGHLAFNDPPADFDTTAPVHIVTLDDACRRQQVGEGHFPTLDAVPRQALSLSIPSILDVDTISCVVPEARKAAAVRGALEGPVTPHCPASALRRHPDCHLFLDLESASLLADS